MLRRPGEYEPPIARMWSRAETKLWTLALFSGTCVLYMARAALPICAAAVSKEFAWNKKDSGTVLSCFFWGYATTQVFAGRLSDKYGGENILPFSSLAWIMLTFFTPYLFDFAYMTSSTLAVLLAVRVLTGVAQAFHVPAMASLVAKNLPPAEKGKVFGVVLAGSHCGTVLAGAFGSIFLDVSGWRTFFQFIGVIALIWCWFLKFALDKSKDRKSSIYDDKETLLKKDSAEPHVAMSQTPEVPWATLFKHPSFWAAAIAQYTGGNAYFTMFNWLPSYFHETFPNEKGFVYNVVPSLAIVVTSLVAPYMAARTMASGKTTTHTRRLMECSSLLGVAVCLLLIPMTSFFPLALIIVTAAMAARGLHHGGVSVNPHDFAPNHAGSVFGVFNACGAITGFIGVYVAGHILEATNNNWSYVFVVTSVQCVLGSIVYMFLGTVDHVFTPITVMQKLQYHQMTSSIQEVYHVVSHRPICFWAAGDVDHWLRKRRPKLALKYSPLFLRHNVTGRVLVDVSDDDLKEIGIDAYDDRQDLLLEIKKEKLYSDLDEFSKLKHQA